MEDPGRKIIDWCGHLAVPRYVDEKAYDRCKGCDVKMGGFLSKVVPNHCRLCGHLFCPACCAKYHVPLIFRIPNKDGPMHVCNACVEGCMTEKAKAAAGGPSGPIMSSLLTSTPISKSLQSLTNQVQEIAPPATWQDPASVTHCPKCSKKAHLHNCRVCGFCYCDTCTRKMDVPQCFEKKPGKAGQPARVCDSCRSKIIGGAKLVERLSNAPKTGPLEGALTQANIADATPSSPAVTRPGPPVAGAAMEVSFKREGTNETVTKFTVPSSDMTLAQLDTLFKKTAPQGQAYVYVFRGQPVPEAFHAVFTAKSLGATLVIRAKHAANGVGAATSGLAAMSLSDTVVSAHNNPFRSDPAAEAKRHAAAEAEARRNAPKKVAVFKRPPTTAANKLAMPAAKGEAVAASMRAAAKKSSAPAAIADDTATPAPVAVGASTSAGAQLSASNALAAGTPVNEICRQRAKKIFGQH